MQPTPIGSEVVWTQAPGVPVPFASYATANEDGTLVAVALDDEVALVHVGKDTATIERVPGWLVPATSPLVATLDAAGGVIAMHDAVRGLDYRAPVAIGGIEWNERTAWRAAPDVLVRAVTAKTSQAGSLDAYAPGDAAPRWHVALDAGIADVAIAGDRVIVQLTDARSRAELAAFALADGRQVWRVPTAATFYDEGALAIDDGTVVTVLGDQAACDTCEKLELHDIASGALTRTVALQDSSILYRAELGNRGQFTALGVSGGELWVRFHQLGGGADSMRATACAFSVFDLASGKSRAARGSWDATLTACEQPVLMAPTRGGLVAITHDDAELAVARLARAP